VALERRRGTPTRTHDLVTESRGEFRLQTGGEIVVEREPGRVVFTTPNPPSAAELIHPFLAPAAAVLGYWHDREAFHAGAFVYRDASWGLIGEREAGKSTLLASLALRGIPIVSDDMLVLDGDVPLAAPRSIDLRENAAGHLGVGDLLGTVGTRQRWRLRLGPVEPPPLRGWIFLRWSRDARWQALPARERIERLSAQRGLRIPPRNPAALLDLAALPSWELGRPDSLRSLERSVDLMLDRLGG
jgi:hypothetical protein